MRLFPRTDPANPPAATLPRPEHVRQKAFQNTCYILTSLQAIAARHPAHLAAMLSYVPGGVRVRHHGRSVPVPSDTLEVPRFTPRACNVTQYTHVQLTRAWPPQRWYAILQQAYLTSVGSSVFRYGHPDAVLFWALGCRVQTDMLAQGPARATTLAALAQMFVAGECVVFFVGTHCWSLVGASMQVPGDTVAWRLTISDPCGWRQNFTVFSNAATSMRYVYAYSVTMGAAAVP